MSLATRMLNEVASRAPGRPARHTAIEVSSVRSSGVYRAYGLVSPSICSLGERHRRTLWIEALEPAHHKLDHRRGSADGRVSEPARVPAVHAPRHHPASWASCRRHCGVNAERDRSGRTLDRLDHHTG